MTPAKLVIIEWHDSRQPVGAWQRISDFEHSDLCKCVSVGFLIYDEEDQKVLAPNMADIEDKHNIQTSGVIHIPTKCVVRVTPLIEVISRVSCQEPA